MRRGALVLALLALGTAACGRGPKPPAVVAPSSTDAPALPNPTAGPGAISAAVAAPGMPLPRAGADVTPADPALAGFNADVLKERYDAAMAEAVGLLADRKLDAALAAFETAGSFRDNDDVVKQAIHKLKTRIEQEATAERVAGDIQAILADGKAEDAARLAAEALLQFGNTESAAALARLARQANSVAAVGVEDKKERVNKFKADYETAVKENNLRAAVLALEQAADGGDDELKTKLDEIRASLNRYDELRARAAELRRDPAQLEDAVAALREAEKVWNTPAIKQDLDEAQFALQTRRERLAVAEFEVRGDIGVPQAGAFLADEILPLFKGRYDLVERAHIARVVEEMKLQNADADGKELEVGLTDDALAREKVGQAAKVRFLVVGSITPVAGITVQARLVDVKTGLIVQTARIVAKDADELGQRLPQLGQILMMTDEQKARFEEVQAKEAPPVAVEPLSPDPDVALPPPPDLPGQVPPPPLIPARPRPPAQPENLKPDQFQNLPAPPQAGQGFPAVVLPVERDLAFRRRAAFVALELGDNLFRRGRFRQAMVQFTFCLNLFPEHRDVRMRVEMCRPLLPPGQVVILPIPRPRVAVLDFLTFGDVLAVPPALGPWTAEMIAPYFSPQYEVADRAEMYWWMGRLGITFADLINDPVARLYLGRALNVRYFLFGNLVQTASFDVYTYLVDAEYGFLASGARVHVRGPLELKLRLGEIAWLTKMAPDERLRIEQNANEWDLLLVEIRDHRRRERFPLAIEAAKRALKLRPNNVEALVLLQESQQKQRERDLIAVRQQEFNRYQSVLMDSKQRQSTFTRTVEVVRLQSEQFAAVDANRLRVQRQREQAAAGLLSQAQVAFQGKRFGVAIQFYESAVALAPSDTTYRELALARARAEETARADAATAAAAREAAFRAQRERELAEARRQLEAERQQRAAADLARRKFQDDRDQREYERLMDAAQKLSAEGKAEQAVAAAQKAKRLRPTAEADRLVTQLLVEVAKANAERQGAAARAELERQLAAERTARVQAELETERNRKQYEDLLAQGNAALQQQKFDAAIERYEAARKLHRTDAVLNALKRAAAERDRALAKAEAEKQRVARQQRVIDNLKKQLADAEAALAAREYEKSVALFREAKKAAPNDVAVLTGLAKAEQLRDQEQLRARRGREEQDRKAMFQKFLDAGKKHLTEDPPKYEAAALVFGEALKIYPNDAQAKDLHGQALAKLNADADAKLALEKKAAQYQAHIQDGRRALAAKQYDAAALAFRQALALVPNDKTANGFLQDTQKAGRAAEVARDVEVKRKQDEARKAEHVRTGVTRVREALSAGKLREATAAYKQIAEYAPNDPEVIKVLAEVRKAQDAEEAAMKAGQQREAQFADLLAKGKAALTDKKADEAARFFSEAVALKPTDAAARTLLAQANKQRDDAGATAAMAARAQQVKKLVDDARAAIAARKFIDADKLLDQAAALAPRDPTVAQARTELKAAQTAAAGTAAMDARKQEYARQLTAARAALAAKKYDDAAKAVAAALTAMPGDRDAATLQAQIEQAKKDAVGAAAMTQRQDEFAKLVTQARTALAGKKYDDAAAAVAAALKLFPADRDALALQQQIARAKQDASGAAAMEAKKQEYVRQMAAARAAVGGKRYDEASRAVAAALAALPGDKDATALHGQIEQAKKDAAAAMSKDADRKRDFARLMLQGRTAMAGKKYADAVTAYQAALALYPTDAEAARALADAKRLADAPRPPPMPPMPPAKPPAYTRQMDAGLAAEKQGKYDQALAAYQAALRVVPGDAAAARKVDFAQAMVDGARAMAARKFPDAVRAFEAALKLFPDDTSAKQALQRAKTGK